MLGKPNRLEQKLFYHGISLESRIPKEHPLRKIKKIVDFDFVRSQVTDLYGTRGNESIDPVCVASCFDAQTLVIALIAV